MLPNGHRPFLGTPYFERSHWPISLNIRLLGQLQQRQRAAHGAGGGGEAGGEANGGQADGGQADGGEADGVRPGA